MMQEPEDFLDDQELLSPPEAYRRLLHSAREADRRYASGLAGEEDYPNTLFESYREDDGGEDGYEEDVMPHEAIDLDKVLEQGEIDWDASVPEDVLEAMGFDSDHFVPEEGEFLEDSYFPGYLDDAIQGKVPYGGEVLVQSGDTSMVKEMSLLEAFDRRVKHEQTKVKERLGISTDDDSWSGAVQGGSDEMDMLPMMDYDVLAAIVGIRIDKKIQNMPETELTKAIDSLTKAEIMSEYQRKYELMQDKTKKIVGKLRVNGKELPPEDPIGPRYPKCPFGDGAGDEEAPKPLEIISYIGSTRGKILK